MAEAKARKPLIVSIVGTRPEAIKMMPVALAAAARDDLDHLLVASGQHGALFDTAVASFGGRVDHRLPLGPGSGNPDADVARLRVAVAEFARQHRPDLVLVQGDTTTALAAALGARDAGVPVGHVEAGLRSHDLTQPFPEEGNRVAIDSFARVLFAPTTGAAANLAAEAVPGEVLVTGNTGIDALRLMRERLRAHPELAGSLPERIGDIAGTLVLVTCHRRENHAALPAIAGALRQLAERLKVTIVLPLHPNPAVGRVFEGLLGEVPAVRLVPAIDYAQTIWLMERATLLLTDSGGLQEEAPAIGCPTLVLREVTERPEAIATGNLRLVGTDPDRIVRSSLQLLDDPAIRAAMSRPAFPYGDGYASARILDAVAAAVAGRP